ncbi:MAG TPA: restriction endonuclease [Actinomycetota bacterium]|nr:restriction endonuclease [Actinomycetota bacterium]
MHAEESPQDRGRTFQRFLNTLFELFDLEPRLAYSLESEQIDGSVAFDTDDYIVEARWTKDPVGREDADVFASKVRRKGKNALGLFVSVSGFTRGALDAYSQATPFMAMDGVDLMAVLGQQIRLDDLLRRKKRHANETGECFLPVSRVTDS